jgi:hypothetical protein
MCNGTSQYDASHRPENDGRRNRAGYKTTISRTDFLFIRVDAMFTTFIERPFTKAFDAIAPTATFPCVSRARNCD